MIAQWVPLACRQCTGKMPVAPSSHCAVICPSRLAIWRLRCPGSSALSSQKNVPVAAASRSIRIRFPKPESDADCGVFLEQSWLTNRAVTGKGPAGFTVTFSDPAPEKAPLHQA